MSLFRRVRKWAGQVQCVDIDECAEGGVGLIACINTVADCGFTCSDGSDVANAVYEIVTTTFKESIFDDTFVDALIVADSTGTFSSGITIDDV